MNHTFLIPALKKYGFGENFIDWIEILLKNQESCVISGEHTTKYFTLNQIFHTQPNISHTTKYFTHNQIFHTQPNISHSKEELVKEIQ